MARLSSELGAEKGVSAPPSAPGATEAAAAMRADFRSLPAEARGRMAELLGESGREARRWWEEPLGTPIADPQRPA